MMSLVNKSGDWTPNYHKILIFFPTKSLKSLRAARIDQLADSNEPAKIVLQENRKKREFTNSSHSANLQQILILHSKKYVLKIGIKHLQESVCVSPVNSISNNFDPILNDCNVISSYTSCY